MKRFIPIIFIIILSNLGSAVQDPGLVFCQLQGYEEVYKDSGIYCRFPDGSECLWEDFRDKECGVEYLKELPCVSEGQSIRIMFQECCEGLIIHNPRPDCEGCIPICRQPPKNIFIRFWGWLKDIF